MKSYLYSLLVNEPLIHKVTPQFKYVHLKKESKTILIHTETKTSNGIIDMTIMKPVKVIDYNGYYTSIGIEIKFNRRIPTSDEKSSILDDIKKKLKDEYFGYLLWLNWDRRIEEDQLKKVKNAVKKYGNIKFFYIDLFSEPVKTNVRF